MLINDMGLALLSLMLLTIWTTVWKGWALWKSAQKNEMSWFVMMLVLNTAGILEIIYTLIVERETTKKKHVEAIGAIIVSLALAWAVIVNLPNLPM